MTTQAGGTIKDFMHRYLEVVPQDTTAVFAPSAWGLGASGLCWWNRWMPSEDSRGS